MPRQRKLTARELELQAKIRDQEQTLLAYACVMREYRPFGNATFLWVPRPKLGAFVLQLDEIGSIVHVIDPLDPKAVQHVYRVLGDAQACAVDRAKAEREPVDPEPSRLWNEFDYAVTVAKKHAMGG